MKALVQASRFKVPVTRQDPLAVAGKDPCDIGECHRPARTALVGIEGDDLALAGLTHRGSPESRSSSLLSRGRSTMGPAGGWATASLRNPFSIIIVCPGRGGPKFWRVGIPVASTWPLL